MVLLFCIWLFKSSRCVFLWLYGCSVVVQLFWAPVMRLFNILWLFGCSGCLVSCCLGVCGCLVVPCLSGCSECLLCVVCGYGCSGVLWLLRCSVIVWMF